jgi:hypothetical protein
MNHQHIYDALVARAQNRTISGYCERHHVIPRALGGSNAKSNIVALTYREHFLAHWLLTKITQGAPRRKMLHALNMMGGAFTGRTGRIIAGWRYDVSRRAQRDAKLGTEMLPELVAALSIRMQGNQYGLGVKLTPNQIEARRARMKGNKHCLGYSHSKTTRQKRGAATKVVWSGYTEKQRAARAAKVSAGFARRREGKGPRPWVIFGMSQRTWYRRGKPLPTATGG